MVGLIEPQLQPECSHQESEEHRPAVAHENLGGFEVPAQKPRSSAEDGGRQCGDQGLAVQVGKQGEENGGHGSDAGAKAVHVVENAEGGRNANDEKDSKDCIQNVASTSAQEHFKNLRVNP